MVNEAPVDGLVATEEPAAGAAGAGAGESGAGALAMEDEANLSFVLS